MRRGRPLYFAAAYPFRYMYLAAPAVRVSGRPAFDAEVDVVPAAVEPLETRGWELVGLERLGTIAFLRRITR